MEVEYPLKVWEVDCEHLGSWRASLRFCKKTKRWVEYRDCIKCLNQHTKT